MTSIDLQVLIYCATSVTAFTVLVGAIWAGSCSSEIRDVLKTWSENRVARARLNIDLAKLKVEQKLCISCQQAIEEK